MSEITIVGRSSSHYSRIVRIFALELGIPHSFRPLLDITSLDMAEYAGNPALKVPVLLDDRGPAFGTENICRDLLRRSNDAAKVIMRGDSKERVVTNLEELTLHAMSSEVSLIMAKMSGDATPASPKVSRSIENCLVHLDERLDVALEALPSDRRFSFLEVALFCLLTHLPFRKVLDIAPWPRLVRHATEFGKRESACATQYRFDSA